MKWVITKLKVSQYFEYYIQYFVHKNLNFCALNIRNIRKTIQHVQKYFNLVFFFCIRNGCEVKIKDLECAKKIKALEKPLRSEL